MEFWFEASVCLHGVNFFICFYGVVIMSTFEWFDMYRIGIEIIGDEYIFVSSAALNWKSPGKIGVEFAC